VWRTARRGDERGSDEHDKSALGCGTVAIAMDGEWYMILSIIDMIRIPSTCGYEATMTPPAP
jgi:hypothetical protein